MSEIKRFALVGAFYDRGIEESATGEYVLHADCEALVLELHRRLAAETLRADQGWQRYEAANADRNALRQEMAGVWSTELQPRLMAATKDCDDDTVRNLLGEAACALAALTGRPS